MLTVVSRCYHQVGMGRNGNIIEDLHRIGVSHGDAVMVHASLRAVGALLPERAGGLVEGGADGLLDALSTVIGDDGTLLMIVGATNEWCWVNERSPEERTALLVDAVPFDALTTPAEEELGVLAEVFRCRLGTVVSDHPEGRFAANGPLAQRLLEDVPWDDYYGVDSPLDRFVHAGGKVLRLGASTDTVTLLHLAENLAELPWKRRVLRHRRVMTPDGPTVRTVTTLDDSEGIVDYPSEYFDDVLADFVATGRARTGVVGNARSELFDAADMVTFATAWLSEHLGPASLAAASLTTTAPVDVQR
jgi:aminoglycoside N3'-acetyltransferase